MCDWTTTTNKAQHNSATKQFILSSSTKSTLFFKKAEKNYRRNNLRDCLTKLNGNKRKIYDIIILLAGGIWIFDESNFLKVTLILLNGYINNLSISAPDLFVHYFRLLCIYLASYIIRNWHFVELFRRNSFDALMIWNDPSDRVLKEIFWCLKQWTFVTVL